MSESLHHGAHDTVEGDYSSDSSDFDDRDPSDDNDRVCFEESPESPDICSGIDSCLVGVCIEESPDSPEICNGIDSCSVGAGAPETPNLPEKCGRNKRKQEPEIPEYSKRIRSSVQDDMQVLCHKDYVQHIMKDYLTYSKSVSKVLSNFKKLVSVCAEMFPGQSPMALETESESNFEKCPEIEKIKSVRMVMGTCVKNRLVTVDFILLNRVSSCIEAGHEPIPLLISFLKTGPPRYYWTGISSVACLTESLESSMATLLDPRKKKNYKSYKICWSLAECDKLMNALRNVIEIWSFFDWSLKAVTHNVKQLVECVAGEKYWAHETLDFLKCLDRAHFHGVGESVHILTNMILKKREVVLPVFSKSVSDAQKSKLMFSRVSSMKLFEEEAEQMNDVDIVSECAKVNEMFYELFYSVAISSMSSSTSVGYKWQVMFDVLASRYFDNKVSVEGSSPCTADINDENQVRQMMIAAVDHVMEKRQIMTSTLDQVKEKKLYILPSFKKLVSCCSEMFPEQPPVFIETESGASYLDTVNGNLEITSVIMVMSESVKCRLKSVDSQLQLKADSVEEHSVRSPLLSAFLKSGPSRYYWTGHNSVASLTAFLQSEKANLLDPQRKKNIENYKVRWSPLEYDRLIDTMYNIVEIWSFFDWTLKAIAYNVKKTMNILPQEKKSLAEETLSILHCLYRAQFDGVGESVHTLTNIILKKREHMLSMFSKSISNSQKSKLLFSPISSMELFEEETIKTMAEG